jgi:hypothetical protein
MGASSGRGEVRERALVLFIERREERKSQPGRGINGRRFMEALTASVSNESNAEEGRRNGGNGSHVFNGARTPRGCAGGARLHAGRVLGRARCRVLGGSAAARDTPGRGRGVRAWASASGAGQGAAWLGRAAAGWRSRAGHGSLYASVREREKQRREKKHSGGCCWLGVRRGAHRV